MTAIDSREVRLAARPSGLPKPSDFTLVNNPAPAPAAGEVQVRNLWMSVDPYMRGRMSDRASYAPPFALDAALQGGAIGTVTASQTEGFKVGDLVESMLGWREAFTAPAAALSKLPADLGPPPQAFLGVLGMPGLTAYTGLLRIGAAQAGDVVFVSGAAGAVGSLVCQIAKIKGCAVIAAAGSDAKTAWLRTIGVDAAFNYKSGPVLERLRAAAPAGLDLYFDNVGGEHLEAALEVARPFARFVECGMIGLYNETAPPPGPRNLGLVIGKRLRMQGFIVTDHADLRGDFLRDMGGWIRDGRIGWEETVEVGLDKAVGAFLKLFSGGNMGKMLVKLG